MSARFVKNEDGTVEPAPGWKRCPRCDGFGVIYTMQATPDMDESETECTCEEGVVPV